MEQTPLPPLVSDEQITWRSIRDIYEAERQRTREVVQALVNGINDARFALFASGKVELANTLAEIEILAKSQLNIEPTK